MFNKDVTSEVQRSLLFNSEALDLPRHVCVGDGIQVVASFVYLSYSLKISILWFDCRLVPQTDITTGPDGLIT